MLDRSDTVKASRDDTIYRGCEFLVLEIEDAIRLLSASAKTLRENYDARKMVEVKLTADNIAKVGVQASTLSQSLASVFSQHLARKPRP